MGGGVMMSMIKIQFRPPEPSWSLVYLVKRDNRLNLTKGFLSADMGCVVQGYLVNLGVIRKHTGSGHDRNLVVSFGGKPLNSEGPGHTVYQRCHLVAKPPVRGHVTCPYWQDTV
ncbi:hypothetical protein M5K25_024857 [Dendrobium thyrsiflorum]|uniref:Uncharacterized protein n=1 Tax=Dendrobium thyrsiflorum TaxID=117978 RepID=A0ABD0U7P1_DENTH